MSRNGSVGGYDSFFGGETVKLHKICFANPISFHDKKGTVARRCSRQLDVERLQRTADEVIEALHCISVAASDFLLYS